MDWPGEEMNGAAGMHHSSALKGAAVGGIASRRRVVSAGAQHGDERQPFGPKQNERHCEFPLESRSRSYKREAVKCRLAVHTHAPCEL
jgi:hypothetical protein